ncbi:uncharacterized protein [Arachis hypogaea]|uniref:uncharacterized protein n=1 Tax=Arachis hypogaea TaxID=3818 RepID=UPI003B21EAC0
MAISRNAHQQYTHRPYCYIRHISDGLSTSGGLDILEPFPISQDQTNRLAEAANKIILQALRIKLADAKGQWADLIFEILWSYNTTPHSTTKETPFRLVYGEDTMIPVEISQWSSRIDLLDDNINNENRRAELDTLDEERKSASLWYQAMQISIQRKYNKRVQPRTRKALRHMGRIF